MDTMAVKMLGDKIRSRARISGRYWFPTDVLTDQECQLVRKATTVKRIDKGQHGSAEKETPVVTWRESNGWMGVPRFWGVETWGTDAATVDATHPGEPLSAEVCFAGQLIDTQPPQVAAVDAVVGRLLERGAALLQLPCGSGKTVCAMAAIARVGRRTLWLVTQREHAEQGADRAAQFLPGCRVGMMYADKMPAGDCDLVFSTVQSMTTKDYDRAVLSQFGLIVADECHHLASEVFSTAIPRVGARYILGLSATPRRKDGCTAVLTWHIAPVTFKCLRPWTTVRVETRRYDRHQQREIVYKNGQKGTARMITTLCHDRLRNAWLVAKIAALLRANRNVIVLTDRLEHIDTLLDGLLNREHFSETTVVEFSGRIKPKQLAMRRRCETIRCYVATYAEAREALDIPRLDSVVLATPVTDVEQAVGRVLRPFPNKPVPLIVDVWDEFSCFGAYGWKRRRWFQCDEDERGERVPRGWTIDDRAFHDDAEVGAAWLGYVQEHGPTVSRLLSGATLSSSSSSAPRKVPKAKQARQSTPSAAKSEEKTTTSSMSATIQF